MTRPSLTKWMTRSHVSWPEKTHVLAKAAQTPPVATSQVDLWATEGVLDLARREKCDTLIVLNRTRANTRLTGEVAQGAADLGAEVAQAQLANRVAYAESLGQGQGAGELARNATARTEIEALLDEVLRRLG